MTQLVGIPGDPDALDSRVRILRTIAVSLGIASKDLRAVANADLVISLAVDEVRDEARQGADDANDIYIRYAGTSAALADYSRELRRVKEAASAAVSAHQNAEGDVDYWVAKRAQYEDEARTPGEDAEHWRRMEQEADQEVDEARSRVAAAVHSYEGLLGELDLAARRAADRIENARRASGTDDTWIDEIEGAIRDFREFADTYLVPILDAVREVCKVVADIIGIVALILTFIPGAQAIAAALHGIAFALNVIALSASLLLFLLGARSFADLTKDAIHFAISTLVKFSGGQLVGKVGVNVAMTITGRMSGVAFTTITVVAGTFALGTIKLVEHVSEDALKDLGDFVVDGMEAAFLGPNTKIDTPALNPTPTAESSGIPDYGFRETEGALGELYDNIGNHHSVSGAR